MNKYHIGFLILVVLTSSIYIMLPDNVRIDIQSTKSIFSVYEDDGWIVSGIEWVNLFDGTKKMRAKHREVFNYTDGDYIVIKRNILYKDDITVNETYKFITTSTDIKLFPVEHEIIVKNGQNKILQYDVTKLLYTDETVKGITSPQSFGHKMKVEWDNGNYYSKIYKYKWRDEGKLTVKYRIENETAVYNVRLFDPPTEIDSCQILNNANTEYVLNQSITSTGLCLNITAENITVDGAGYNITFNTGSSNEVAGIINSEKQIFDDTPDMNLGRYHQGYDGFIIKNITIINGGSSNRNDVIVSSGNNTRFEDITITYGSATWSAGIFITNNSYNVTIDNIYINQTNDVSTSNNHYIWLRDSSNITINDADFTLVYHGTGLKADRTTDVIVNNMTILGKTISTYDFSYARLVEFKNSTINMSDVHITIDDTIVTDYGYTFGLTDSTLYVSDLYFDQRQKITLTKSYGTQPEFILNNNSGNDVWLTHNDTQTFYMYDVTDWNTTNVRYNSSYSGDLFITNMTNNTDFVAVKHKDSNTPESGSVFTTDANGDASFSLTLAGNTDVSIEVDTAPTRIDLINPDAFYLINSKTISFNITPEDNAGFTNCSLLTDETGSFIVEETDTSIDNNITNTIIHTFPTDGTFIWNVECYDTGGNYLINTTNRTVTVDTTLPTITINSPENISYYDITEILLNWSSDERLLNATYDLNGIPLNFETLLCYQETATTATDCGGLSTGAYSVSGVYVYINYTTATIIHNTTKSLVKHGDINYDTPYNITIPTDCIERDVLQLRLYSYDDFTDSATSYGQCYNGNSWETFTDIYVGGQSVIGDAGSSASIYDGNWGTESYRSPIGWKDTGGTLDSNGSLFEEAIWWNFTNMTFNVNVVDGQNNITIHATDLAGNVNSTTTYFFIGNTTITINYTSGDDMEFDTTSYHGTFPITGQSDSIAGINITNDGNINLNVNLTVNTTYESCFEFWMSNDSTLDTSTDYNVTNNMQTIITDLSINESKDFWGWIIFDQCTAGTIFWYTLYYDPYES